MDIISDFRGLFKWLGEQHHPLLDDRLTGTHRNVFDQLATVLPPADDNALEGLLPSAEKLNCDFIRAHKFLYLSPNPGQGTDTKLTFLPVVAVRCNFSGERPEVRLNVAMAVMKADGDIRVLGFRYEAPEGSGDGLHDFYHAQLIQSFVTEGAHSIPLNRSGADIDWIPTTQPSIPLDACCPVTLALSLLVSLYGLRYLEKVFLSQILPKAYFESMYCWRNRPQYLRVKANGTVRFIKHPSIPIEKLKMILCAKLNVKGVVLESCSASQYESAEPGGKLSF
jgi:hypothetical protein